MIGQLAATAADSGVARPVLLNSLRAVLHAGFESAGRLLGIGLAALLADPTALTRLTGSDPGPAVEETRALLHAGPGRQPGLRRARRG